MCVTEFADLTTVVTMARGTATTDTRESVPDTALTITTTDVLTTRPQAK